jgi:hypothetical protein
MKFFLVFLFIVDILSAKIDLYKFEHKDANNTLFIVGGIHGNEPGGYFAPAFLIEHYKITSNNLWVIPNLNRDSIRANRRGVNGDMNRKFATIKKNDKDKKIVEELKKLIKNKQVSLILNLHDGHGFYRKKYNSTVFNPNAWGQSCVIDQCKISLKESSPQYKDLKDIATKVTKNVNKKLLKKHHKFNVKNTKTKFDDEAMQLSLTYFAVTNNKPAFAIETSKNLSTTAQKVFYQLLAIEEFMKIMDIQFTRDFKLTIPEIEKILKEYGTLNINGNISLNLTDTRKYLSYIPLKSKDNVFEFSHPVGVVQKNKGRYDVYIGHKKVTTLKPQYFNLEADCPTQFNVVIDGKPTVVKKASKFDVKKEFLIKKNKNLRTNVIGFSSKNVTNESDINIKYKDMNRVYSVDKSKKTFRIEFYKKEKFCSMLMVHFK